MGAIEITSHEEIRHWAEERGGKPAHVRNTSAKGAPGLLRIDFGGPADELEDVDWDTWFDEFDDAKLALVVEEETGQGELNRESKLVHRHEPVQ